MENDVQDVLVLMIKLFRRQQKKLDRIGASVVALKVVVARALSPDFETAQRGFAEIEAQCQPSEEDRLEREQVDAIVSLVEHGKHRNAPDG